MNTIEANIDIYMGAAFVAEITCYEDKAQTQPFDFTDYDGVAGVFSQFGEDEIALADLVLDFNIDRTDGVVRFTMTKAAVEASSLTPGSFVWDSLLGASTAQEEVFFRGIAEVHPQGARRSA